MSVKEFGVGFREMKKFLGILILGLMFCSNAYARDGHGDMKFDKYIFKAFVRYIIGEERHGDYEKGMDKGKPIIFAVTQSGKYSYSYYCPSDYFKKYGGCGSPNVHVADVQGACRRNAKERGSSERCYIFAKGYKIVWNSANHKIPRNATPAVIEKALRELGFYGQQASKKIEKKIEKKESKIKKKSKKKMSDDVVQQIKELKQLYDDGILTQEEFTKAKKKLLN